MNLRSLLRRLWPFATPAVPPPELRRTPEPPVEIDLPTGEKLYRPSRARKRVDGTPLVSVLWQRFTGAIPIFKQETKPMARVPADNHLRETQPTIPARDPSRKRPTLQVPEFKPPSSARYLSEVVWPDEPEPNTPQPVDVTNDITKKGPQS